MRTLIVNAVVIDGTGAKARPDSTVVIQDHIIEEVVPRPAVYYDRADILIDAHGGFVIPGLINHHAHGLTRGPFLILGEPPLSDARVQTNLDRFLSQGVTTALNVDGFPTTEDAIASSRFHPLSVKVSTLHTPTHLTWATQGPLCFDGVKQRHRWTVEKMLARGAVAIGEAGPGLDPHWTDYALIPRIVSDLGGNSSPEHSSALRVAAEGGERSVLLRLLHEVGVEPDRSARFEELFAAVHDWTALARRSLDEAIQAAYGHGVPLIFHHTPATHDTQLEAAKLLGERLIAAHSNFQCSDPDEAKRRAREVKQRGGLVDIASGDAFGAREFHGSPSVTFALLAAGLVDLMSTDYTGGFWDSMLLVVDQAYRNGVISLEQGVRLITSAPADAIPGLAPDRGVVATGRVADLVVTFPNELAMVKDVLVSGRSVTAYRRERT